MLEEIIIFEDSLALDAGRMHQVRANILNHHTRAARSDSFLGLFLVFLQVHSREPLFFLKGQSKKTLGGKLK